MNLCFDGSVVSGYVDIVGVSICQVPVSQLVLVCYEPQFIPQIYTTCGGRRQEIHQQQILIWWITPLLQLLLFVRFWVSNCGNKMNLLPYNFFYHQSWGWQRCSLGRRSWCRATQLACERCWNWTLCRLLCHCNRGWSCRSAGQSSWPKLPHLI